MASTADTLSSGVSDDCKKLGTIAQTIGMIDNYLLTKAIEGLGVSSMSDYFDLSRFSLELFVVGIHKDKDPNVKQEFDKELQARPHIEVKSVDWDDKTNQLIIRIVTEGTNVEMVDKQMLEEFFEISCAILHDMKGVNIKVREVGKSII